MKDNSNRKLDSVLQQLVEVGARVTVTPLVRRGKTRISHVGSRVQSANRLGRRKRTVGTRRCTFNISQVLCVRVPLTFGVEVDVEQGKVLKYSGPTIGPCSVGVDLPQPPRSRYNFVRYESPRALR